MAKFDLKDPNNQKLLLGIMLMVGVVYLFYSFSYVPQREKIAELTKSKQEKEIRLKKAQRRAAKYEQLVADVNELEQKLQAAQEKLPKEKDIPTILTNITRIGNAVMSPVTMVRPQNIIKKDFYAEVPITVNVEGSYHGFASFLARVGNLTRIINPSGLNIKAITRRKKKGEKEGVAPSTIKVSMTARTFIFLPKEEQETW